MNPFTAETLRNSLPLAAAALFLGFGAVWMDRLLPFPASFVAALACWWLALACVAQLAAFDRKAERAEGTARWPHGLAVVGVIATHGVLLIGCLAFPLRAWLAAPSLAATLAMAAAVTLAMLLPWRIWPMLAFVAMADDVPEGQARSAGRILIAPIVRPCP